MVILVYNSDEQRKKIEDSVNTESFIFYNINNLKDYKKARSEMRKLGAALTPFASVYKDGKIIKGFWSESQNVIDDLIKYLNEDTNNR